MTSRIRSRLLVLAALAPLAGALLGTLASRPVQAPPATPAQRRTADLLHDVCVYKLPGMDDIRVKSDIVFAPGDSGALKLDLYLPARPPQDPPPVVVFVNGVGPVNGIPMRSWGIYRSWARLAAVRGLAAVVHDVRRGHEAEDAAAALAHVHREAKALGVDGDDIVLWSCSANVRVGWPLATDPANGHVKAAVI